MTAPFYPGNRILMNTGEGVSSSDLNLMQAVAESRLWDMYAGALAQSSDGRGFPGTFYGSLTAGRPALWAMGGAPVIDSLNVLTVKIEAGVWLFYDNATGVFTGDGNTIATLSYGVRDGEFSLTSAIGDATNPRIDSVVVKIERIENDAADTESRAYQAAVGVASVPISFIKRSKTRATVTLLPGTPAGSPTAPATPAGYAKLCDVYIPALFNSTHGLTAIRDHRYPLGWHTETMFLSGTSGDRPSGDVSQFGGWAYNANQLLACTTPGATCWITPRPRARHGARLHSIAVAGKLNHSTITLGRIRAEPTNTGAFTVTTIADVTSSFNNGINVLNVFAASGVGATVDPIWGNGYAAGIAAYRNDPIGSLAACEGLVLQFGAGASAAEHVKMVQFNWHTL